MQADLQETSQEYIKQVENLKELVAEKEKQISRLQEDNEVIKEQNDQQVSALKLLEKDKQNLSEQLKSVKINTEHSLKEAQINYEKSKEEVRLYEIQKKN